MNLELTNKHVLIAGGSKGIGLACARTFLAEGARVTLVSRFQENLLAAQAALLKEAPGATVDILAADALTAAWHDAMQAKFFTYIHVINALIKRMGERGDGAVVSIIGCGGKVATVTHLAGGAANAALMLASAELAAAYAGKGVRVNAVNPGLTLTERLHEGMQAEARQHGISIEEALTRAKATRPLGRIAEPSEIADAVVYLASNRASYITGASVAMDGVITPMVV